MKATLMVPIDSLRGKLSLGSDYYVRMLYGKVIIQRCPKRSKPPTSAQLEARRKFVEKYAHPSRKHPNGNEIVM